MLEMFSGRAGTVVRPCEGTPIRYGVAQCAFMVLGVILVAFAIKSDVDLAVSSGKQWRSSEYSTTTGVVTRSELTGGRIISDVADDIQYRTLEYTYCVDGRTYFGAEHEQRLCFDCRPQQMVAEHSRGSHLTVYYDPEHPTDAVLHRGFDGSDWCHILAAGPLNLAALAFTCVAVRKMLRFVAIRSTAGVRTWIEGDNLRVRLPRWDPLMAAFVVCTAVNVAGIIQFEQSLLDRTTSAVLMVFGAMLVSGAGTYLYLDGTLAGGSSDLVINPVGQTVTLPKTFGRWSDVVVAMQSIIGVEIDQIEQRDWQGRVSFRFAPALVVNSNIGSLRREKLVEWQDLGAAEDLAAWLREKLWIASGGDAQSESSGPTPSEDVANYELIR